MESPATTTIAHSPEDFGRQIQARRKALGLSQVQVAAVVGTDRRVVGQLENGKPTVQMQIAMRVAQAVGLDLTLAPRNP